MTSFNTARMRLDTLRTDPANRTIGDCEDVDQALYEGTATYETLGTTEAELKQLRRAAARSQAEYYLAQLRRFPGSTNVMRLLELIANELVKMADIGTTPEELLPHVDSYLRAAEKRGTGKPLQYRIVAR